jgi:NAD(P)-dependent dehydrogenase (short-subunit alcohol dehydrogenase family)
MGLHKPSILAGVLAAPVLLALLVLLIDFVTRVEYRVHTPQSSAVIVTGASTGIGRHAAEELARQGFAVYASVRSDADEAELKKVGLSTLIPFRLDVTDPKSRVAAIERVDALVAKSGRKLMGLVNNAGIASGLPLELHALDDARLMFDVNYFGMMHLTQLCLPSLRANGGRVVQLSSVTGRFATRTRGVYSSTKFAMEAFSDALRMELIPWKISVSVVEPGYVKSAIAASGAARVKGLSSEEKRAQELYPHLYPPGWYEKNEHHIATGAEPTVTTEAIVDALTNPYPSTRYPVAKAGPVDAKVFLFALRFIPDRLRDFLLVNLGG